MKRLHCLLTGHPEWRETTIVVPRDSFGQQYMVTFGSPPAEIEASILNGRAFRCVRCHAGRVVVTERRAVPRYPA